MSSFRFDHYSKSNSIGPHHNENQDSFLVDEQNLLFAVADGVGGYLGAKQASSIAVETLSEHASDIIDEASLEEVIEKIHERILAKAETLHFPNMGTTLAVLKLLPDLGKLIVGNVGDSPILMVRNNSMESIYEDDSHRSRDPKSMYEIVQYLGLGQKLDIHMRSIQLTTGDTILLCSDGITDNLLNSVGRETELASMVMLNNARMVVEAAIERGVKADDMTAVIVALGF